MSNTGDTERSTEMSKNNESYATGANKYWPAVLKVLELIISVVCIGLIDDPANGSRNRLFIGQRTLGLAYATFATYLIVSTVYVLGKCVRDIWPWKTSAVLSFVGTILYLASAIALFSDWSDTKAKNYWPPNTTRLDLLCATASISVVGAVVFLFDFVSTAVQGARGYLD